MGSRKSGAPLSRYRVAAPYAVYDRYSPVLACSPVAELFCDVLCLLVASRLPVICPLRFSLYYQKIKQNKVES